MTGFIKPAEILSAQQELVELMDMNGMDLDDLDRETREFMKVNPVTKEKEDVTFRKVNGVFVTEEDFKESERLQRPIDGL